MLRHWLLSELTSFLAQVTLIAKSTGCTGRFQRGVYGTYDEFAGPKLYHQDATASKFSNVRNSHGLRLNDPSRVNCQYGAEDDDSDTEDRLRREYNERKRKYSPTPEYDPPMPEIDDMRIPPHLNTWRRAVSGKITKQTQAEYEQEQVCIKSLKPLPPLVVKPAAPECLNPLGTLLLTSRSSRLNCSDVEQSARRETTRKCTKVLRTSRVDSEDGTESASQSVR
jgi:hypothetical protein